MLTKELKRLVQIARDCYITKRMCEVTVAELREHAEEIRALRRKVDSITIPDGILRPSDLYELARRAKEPLTRPSIGYRLYIIGRQSELVDIITDAQDYGDILVWEREGTE